jgi:hypothetical protein
MLKSLYNASYRFLPAIITSLENYCAQTTALTFSEVIRRAIAQTKSPQKYIFNSLSCINDTGIRACGTRFEHVKNIYISSGLKTGQGSIILAIQNPYHYKDLYFKGTWNTSDMNITVWCELMPERALAEISFFAQLF